MKKLTKIILAIILILIVLSIGLFVLSNGDSEVIGENNLGSVYKVTYGDVDAPIKIGLISGMHSREKVHQLAIPLVSRIFALNHNVEIVNYVIDVKDSPDDFYKGRANGESLVHDYVVNDVSKSNLDLVIVGHDHEKGYGEGYYIATPTMDDGSVNLATKTVDKIGFNYYKRDKNSASKSTSINAVDTPIVNAGAYVFVYEIPEFDFKTSAIINTYILLDGVYNILAS